MTHSEVLAYLVIDILDWKSGNPGSDPMKPILEHLCPSDSEIKEVKWCIPFNP